MKAIYISALDHVYSRSGVYFDGDPGSKEFIKVPGSRLALLKLILKLVKENSADSTIVVVMSPNHILVPWIKLFSNFRVVLDAGWPLSDSHPGGGKLSQKIHNMKNQIIDFISFQLADKVILETDEQLDFVSKKFLVNEKKLYQLYTGFNEAQYSRSIDSMKCPMECQKLEEYKSNFVLFRGKANLESGIKLIIESAGILPAGVKIVIVTNREFREVPANTIVISRFLAESEILWLYKHATAVLGQCSTETRLSRTIPHKLFEAAYFAKCYISPSSRGLQSFFKSNQFVAVDEISRDGIASSITWAMNNELLRASMERAAKKSYSELATQEILSTRFRTIIESN